MCSKFIMLLAVARPPLIHIFIQTGARTSRCAIFPRTFSVVSEPQHHPKPSTKATFIPPKSALFVSGSYAQYAPFVITPCLEFHEYFAKVSHLESEITARQLPLNVKNLQNAWNTIQDLWKKRKEGDDRKKEFQARITPSDYMSLPEEVKQHGRQLRDNLKKATADVEAVATDIVIDLLKIPTWLHEKTPRNGQELIVQECGVPVGSLQLETFWKDCVEWTDSSPNGYFLRGAAAELELKVVKKLKKELELLSYNPLSGPHLLKAIALESSATGFLDSSQAFMLDTEESRNSVFRSAFLINHPLNAFAVYFTNAELNPKDPLVKYHHSGRIYSPRQPIIGLKRLLHPVQTQCVSFCIGYGDPAETDQHLFEVVENMRNLYSFFEIPFKITIQPADKLGIYEGIRYNFDVWSTSQQEFINCGYVSANNDFLSRRIRFHIGKQDDEFVHVIHGSAVTLTPFLACFLEHHSTDLETWINSKLKDF